MGFRKSEAIKTEFIRRMLFPGYVKKLVTLGHAFQRVRGVVRA